MTKRRRSGPFGQTLDSRDVGTYYAQALLRRGCSWIALGATLGLALVAGCTADGLLVVEVRSGSIQRPFQSIELSAGGHRKTYPVTEGKLGLYVPPGSYMLEAIAFDESHKRVASGRYPDPITIRSRQTAVLAIDLAPAVDPGEGGMGGLGADAGDGADVNGFDTTPMDIQPETEVGEAGQDAPRPRGCSAAAGTRTLVPLLVDGFEGCPTSVVSDCPGWVRAGTGWVSAVSTDWVYEGTRNVKLRSFTTSTEIVYTQLPLTEAPARLVLELVYTPDGSFITQDRMIRDFGEFGFGRVLPNAKYDLTPLLALHAQDHALMFKAAPGPPIAGPPWQGDVVFQELGYARMTQSEAPVHNFIRLDVDFCARTASIYAGTATDPPLRMTVPIGATDGLDVVYLTGGYNFSFYDSLVVKVDGP